MQLLVCPQSLCVQTCRKLSILHAEFCFYNGSNFMNSVTIMIVILMNSIIIKAVMFIFLILFL
jgi:hypothetical protein